MSPNVSSKQYPGQIVTVGDHIRKVRIDAGLYHKNVAEMVGVSTCTVNNWEQNHGEPEIRYMPAIIKFLGYVPFECPTDTLGRLAYYKRVNGMSFERLGVAMGKDSEQLMDWLSGRNKPFRKSLEKIDEFLLGKIK